MKRKRFSEEQIIGILNEAAAGAAAVEVCRISDFSPSFAVSVRRTGEGQSRARHDPTAADQCSAA